MKRVFTLVICLAALVALTVTQLGSPSAAASSNPGAEYVPDGLLVRFQPGAAAAEQAQARRGLNAELKHSYTLVPGLEYWKLPPGLGVSQAMQALSRNPNILYAEPDYIVTADLTPNDPGYVNQLLYGMDKINAPAAWDITTGNAGFVVGIIDTGIDYNHPDLQANMWHNPGEFGGRAGVDDDGNGYIDDVYGWDFAYGDSNPMDVHSHGTHCAGTVGGVGNNQTGVAGVNWNVKLAALKFLNDSGSGATSNAILAVQYAVIENIKVTNNSWGGGSYSQALYDAINASKSIGHLFVAAAGNNGTNNDATPFYPASYALDNVIAVASTDSSDLRSGFSNYGLTSVDIGAPGSSIYSTLPNNGYGYKSGTSMASPHASGALALVYGYHPGFTYQQVRDAIFSTVRPLASLAGITVTGGIIDVAAALGEAPPPTPTPPTPTPPTPTPPTPTPPTPTPPPGKMHLGVLSGQGILASSVKWNAVATVTVEDATGAPVAGALVSGAWSAGTKGTGSCTTGANGSCTITKNSLALSKVSSVVFTVTGMTHTTLVYDPAGNVGSLSVTIYKP